MPIHGIYVTGSLKVAKSNLNPLKLTRFLSRSGTSVIKNKTARRLCKTAERISVRGNPAFPICQRNLTDRKRTACNICIKDRLDVLIGHCPVKELARGK